LFDFHILPVSKKAARRQPFGGSSQQIISYRCPFLKRLQFNENYELHGMGSTVNFLGVAQDGEYHRDVFKATL
jgi:hypothetical protein